MSVRKLYIRTFGCQMNEYDSDKMADVLGASDGVVITDLDGAAVQSNASWLGILGDGDPGDSTRWWQGFVGNFREAEAGFADWTRLRSLTEQLQSACFEMTDGRIFETTTTPHRPLGG